MKAIACGFTANVDGVARLDNALLSRIARRCNAASAAAELPNAYVATWEELHHAIEWTVQNGSGAEYIITGNGIMEELKGMAEWRWGVGGTGLQAACAAAIAGRSSLVNLPYWSKEYDFLIHHSGLAAEMMEEGHVPVHYILEYSRPHTSNRIILRAAHEFKNGLIAPSFADRLRREAGQYRRLLISGYNSVDTSAEVLDLLDEQIRLLQSLGEDGPSAHLELAAIFTREDQLRIIEQVGPLVDSIGLNEDEMRELMLLDRPLLELSDAELIALLKEAHQKFGVPNLILHTQHFAVCVSDNNASPWEPALRNGVRFASSKAAQGRFCTMAEMELWDAKLPPHPRGVRLKQFAQGIPEISVAPSLRADPVLSTIGLGDTFTAGLILAAPILQEKN